MLPAAHLITVDAVDPPIVRWDPKSVDGRGVPRGHEGGLLGDVQPRDDVGGALVRREAGVAELVAAALGVGARAPHALGRRQRRGQQRGGQQRREQPQHQRAAARGRVAGADPAGRRLEQRRRTVPRPPGTRVDLAWTAQGTGGPDRSEPAQSKCQLHRSFTCEENREDAWKKEEEEGPAPPTFCGRNEGSLWVGKRWQHRGCPRGVPPRRHSPAAALTAARRKGSV